MKTNKKTVWIILVIALLVPLLLTMGKVFAYNNTIPQAKTPYDHYKAILKGYEDELKSDKTSQEEKDLLKKKYASIAQDATLSADALKKAKPDAYETLVNRTATSVPITQHVIPDGIDNPPVIPIPNVFPQDIFPANGWHKGIGNDGTLFVYAGYAISDPSQGLVYLKEPGKTLKFKKFIAPENSGKLRIVSEDKMVLTLQNEIGQTFYFDAKKEGFVDQNGNVIPEGTDGEVTPTPISPYPAP